MPNLSKALGLSLASKQSSKQKITNLSCYTWYLLLGPASLILGTEAVLPLNVVRRLVAGLASSSPAFINFLRQGLTVLPWPA